MARFLHIADIHLGIKRYNMPNRTFDFYRAWKEVIERYAIGRAVDFVLIAGDLFDKRQVDPLAADHAMAVLKMLERARTPVVVIEGNHDQHEATSRFSWLRSFSRWGYLKLLEPVWEVGNVRLDPWDDAHTCGSFIDIGDARIFGSSWYGTTIGNVLPLLAEGLRNQHRPDAANVLLLHADIEGQLGRPTPNAVSAHKLGTLHDSIDYLALGHTHKRFDIDGWIFNPGSLEACSVDEVDIERGAYVVEMDRSRITTEFIQAGRDFYQRPFKRLTHHISDIDDPESVTAEVLEVLRRACTCPPETEEEQRPIVELTLRGSLGFSTSLLRLDKLKHQIIEELRPMGIIINNKTVPKQLAVAMSVSADTPRNERELRVIEDLIRMDSRFGHRASEIAAFAMEAKRMALDGEPPETILRMIEESFFPAADEAATEAIEVLYA